MQPFTQLMGELHESRLAEGELEFVRTVADYFGPIEVEFGCGRVDVDGEDVEAFFTSMTIRAV